ncbi:Bifunctional ligase/repressor BirA [bacterium HR21]|nr:Bifunctional ligase/repressor BirA [bacterium HR21]
MQAMGFPHFRYQTVSSTNDVARELLRQFPCVFVSALFQTRGRGRHGRSWFGEFGNNVYCSLGIRHAHLLSASEAASYLALGALALWETVSTLTTAPEMFRVKYPNDLLGRCPDGIWRKLAGVLVEHIRKPTEQLTIIGIGLNVRQTSFPPSLVESATSLALLGFDIAPEEALQHLKGSLEALSSTSPAELLQRWRAVLKLEGQRLLVQGKPGIWTARRLLDDGRLEIEHCGMRTFVTDGDSIRYVFD